MIMHIDMDAFFASIEQAINPALKGKPLIVGSRNNRFRTVVCAASYEAKKYGITSGMASLEAFRLCPELKFVPAEQAKYLWTSEQILELLKEYGFEIHYASIDEFQLDIRDHDQPLELAEQMRQRIRQRFRITASTGIAKNFLLAKLASKLNKPDGCTMISEDTAEGTLAVTPVKKLCGIGERTLPIMHGLGIYTCLDLYRCSAAFLNDHLGKNGIDLYAALHAQESFSGQNEDYQPKSVSHSYTLPKASQTPGFIRSWIRLLSEMVGERLRQKKLVSLTTHVWLNRPQQQRDFAMQKTFEQETNDGWQIYKRCLKIIDSGGPLMAVRALGVTCSNLHPHHYAEALLKEDKKRTGLNQSIDRINETFGEATIFPAILLRTRKIE